MWIVIAAFGALLMLQGGGVMLAGPISTAVACAAILVFGLPHGTLDLAIIRRERDVGLLAMSGVLFCYLALAGLMAAIWQFAPVAALAIFILIAVVHFAEDWSEIGSPFLAQGMAIALISAPALLNVAVLEQVFVALCGSRDAMLVANVLLLVAPMSLGVAAVGIGRLWQTDREDQAIVGTITLAGMILLPPVVGFAMFFVLHHSPSQLKISLARTGGAQKSWRTITLLTLAALGISATLFVGEMRADLPDQFVAASFMTLSLLTVPHMVVPAMVEALAPRRSDRPRNRPPQIRHSHASSSATVERRAR